MRSWIAALVAVGTAAGGALHAQTAAVSGCWSGTVLDGSRRFRAALELEVAGDGAWRGTFHALRRVVGSDSVTDVAVEGDAVRFGVPAVGGARFAGRIGEGGAALAGDATVGERTGPFTFERAHERHPARALTGFWSGALEQHGAVVLRVVVKVEEAPCGDVLVRMDSPDQGATNLPVSGVTVAADSFAFEMAALDGAYGGAVSRDGRRISGQWTQGGATFTLNLARSDSVVTTRRPQEPVPPYPYDTLPVSFEHAGMTFAGTLTIPRGEGPFPAAVLLSGSGAQDRNETLMGHRPFLVLADYLTRRGIAVLRVDDRGVGGSGGSTLQATLDDNAGDALAAVEFLRKHPGVDPARVGLIGHSEGGWVAPLAASRSGAVAFMVLLAGPGVSGEELLYAQQAALLRAEGASDALVAAYRAYASELFAVIREGGDVERAGAEVERRRGRVLDSLPDTLAAALDSLWAATPEAQRRAQLAASLTPWFRYLLDYDPRPALARVRVPLLALIGEKDLQVPPAQNIPALREGCRASGHPDCTVLELEGLNHLFQTAPTGRVGEYGRIEETFAPAALELIGEWIVRRFGRGGS